MKSCSSDLLEEHVTLEMVYSRLSDTTLEIVSNKKQDNKKRIHYYESYLKDA
jgi:hypothetical protein